MTSKNKIVDAFSDAYEQLSGQDMPPDAGVLLRQLHRAFTDLRHHDSELSRAAEEMRVALELAEKNVAELENAVRETDQARRDKDNKAIAKDFHIAALQKEVRLLSRTH